MSQWFAVFWPLTLASLLVTVPGLVVGAAAGLRRQVLVGVAPTLSLGALGVADIVGTKAHLSWGLPLVVGVVLGSAVVSFALGRLASRVETRWGWQPEVVSTRPAAAVVWAVTLVVAALVGALTVARGMGAPDAISQTFDAPFHVNAIELVVQHRSAAPDVVASAASPDVPVGFYPPLFHGVAGLVVILTGVTPVVAANVVAVIIAAVIWPVSISLLVRVTAGPSAFAHVVAMAGSVLVALFPALMLHFGVLWPNALSIAGLPGAIALVAYTLALAQRREVSPVLGVLALLFTLPGIYYAHPGAAFVLLAVAIPMVAAFEAAVVRRWWPLSPRHRWAGVGLVAGTIIFAVVFWIGLGQIQSLNRVRAFTWPAQGSPAEALGEVLTLGTPIDPDLWIYGLLVLIGVVVLARSRRWWLVAAHALLCWFAILAIAYKDDLAQAVTGFWYNDPFRIMAPVALTAVPLGAVGALAWRDAWVRVLWTHFASTNRGLLNRVRTQAVPVVSVVVLGVVGALVPDTFGLSRISNAIATSYTRSTDVLVSPGEQRLYSSLGPYLRPGQTIIGNPWSGEVYAGVLSGHDAIWPHLSIVASPDRQLLAQRFKYFATDPAVCAAVKRLKIGVAVEDTQLFWQDRGEPRIRSYPGLTGLSHVPGLTKIGQGDSATAYKVGDCRS